MKNAVVLISLVCVMAAVNLASADNIHGINVDFVNIGNAGNAADTTGHGAVGYNYRIGKYEVPNSQWNAFTTAAGAPTGNPSSAYGHSAWFTDNQQPTNEVSWYEAAQFCNYLTSGNKSKGAYQFSGNNTNPSSFLGIDRVSSISTYGTTYVIPTEDEWYKAAFYKPNGSGYSLYANGTNIAPVAGVNSNYNDAIGAPWDITNGTQEQNGTFNMMGNIWELTEIFSGSNNVVRGGSFDDSGPFGGGNSAITSAYWASSGGGESLGIGFRIAEIPEPTTICLFGIAGLMLRRKK
jgi:hypothetical protein